MTSRLEVTVEEGTAAERLIRRAFYAGSPCPISLAGCEVRLISLAITPRMPNDSQPTPRSLTYTLEYTTL